MLLFSRTTHGILFLHCNQTIVHSKWIFRTKYKADGTLDRYKAKLLAKGFQQTPGVDFFDTFSPVLKPSTINIIFTIAVTGHWNIKSMHIFMIILSS